MEIELENGEEMRKWRDSPSTSPYFLFISSQNVKYGAFVANVTINLTYEKIILGQTRCEEALQVVPAWHVAKIVSI